MRISELRAHGYTQGHYTSSCTRCTHEFSGGLLATVCRRCAVGDYQKAQKLKHKPRLRKSRVWPIAWVCRGFHHAHPESPLSYIGMTMEQAYASWSERYDWLSGYEAKAVIKE